MAHPVPEAPTRPVVPATAAVALALLFAVLGVAVAAGWSPPWGLDLAVEPVVHTWMLAHPGVVTATIVVTDLGSPVAMNILTVAVAIGLWVARRRGAAIVVVAVRLVELGIETAVKAVVDRPRPTLPMPLDTASSSSFPSGHSAGTAAVVGIVLVLVVTATRIPAAARAGLVVILTLLLLAVPVSRVALGVHYPSDAMAGLVLGLACAAAGHAVLCTRVGRRPDADPTGFLPGSDPGEEPYSPPTSTVKKSDS